MTKDSAPNIEVLEVDLGSKESIMLRLGLNKMEYETHLNKIEKCKGDIDKILGEDGILSKYIVGYSPRLDQIESAKLIAEALANNEHVVLEGPCGFGKTFAYLLPKLVYDYNFNKHDKMILSTDGISLQEQLYHKDLKTLNQISQDLYGQGISYTMVKGRQNYLCLNKLNELTMGNPKHGRDVQRVIDSYNAGEFKTLEFSNLNYTPEYDIIKVFACTEEGECLSGNCPYFEKCPYQKSKIQAQSSKYVVTNYHMLFSDLMIGGQILGEYSHIVMDEGHKVANIYREFKKKSFTRGSMQWICNQLTSLGNKDKGIKELFLTGMDTTRVLVSTDEYLRAVENLIFFKSRENVKLIDSTMDLIYDKAVEAEMLSCLRDLGDRAYRIKEDCELAVEALVSKHQNYYLAMEYAGDQMLENQKLAAKAKRIFERVTEVADLLTNYKSIASSDKNVFWVERDDRGASIHTMPTEIGEDMYENILNTTDTTIITSATLSVGGKFDYISNSLGLSLVGDRRVIEKMGESPFDLTKQERWYLPKDLESGVGSNSQRFRQSLPIHIQRIIDATGGGVLCLFTSYSNMNMAYDEISNKNFKCLQLLKQGDMPRVKLLEKFSEDRNSVLFATKSFFTGVDVRGDSLRAVVIDKLPFPTPNDPLMMKMEDIYGNKTFFKVSIPEMVIDLKQAVGRGVRSINDKCVIAILDNRLTSSRYSKKVLTSFPYRKVGARTKDDIVKFLGDEGENNG